MTSYRCIVAMWFIIVSGCVTQHVDRVEKVTPSPAATTPAAPGVPERPAPADARLESYRFLRVPATESLAVRDANRLEVHFIDVGQGDCTLVICPDGKRLLIDAGSSSKGFDPTPVRDYILSKLDLQNPRIDTLVITHPDADHYNLLPIVLEEVDVGHVFMVGTIDEYSDAVENWLGEFDRNQITRMKGSDYNVAQPKSLGDFGQVQVRVLAANVEDISVGSEKNTRSIVLKVTLGTWDFLLTGDATFDTENSIMARVPREALDVEVLKIGHHGSRATSTSDDWARTVKPEIAVVSAGHKNGYGHPHRDVIRRLEPFTQASGGHAFRWSWRQGTVSKYQDFPAYAESIYCTNVSGNIVIATDGARVLDIAHDN